MAIPRYEVCTQEVRAVGFSFFTDDEVKALSVMQVTNPQTFDNLGVPRENGLYDSRMGPCDIRGNCGTCRLDYHSCPGHFGHVELPVPVYNPLVFTAMYKLTRATCQQCFRFKLAAPETSRFRRRMEALLDGDMLRAGALAGSSDAGMKLAQTVLQEGGEEDGMAAPTNFEETAEERLAGLRRAGPSASRPRMTAQTVSAMRECVREFLARMPPQKCANCGAHCPTIKKEGASKLFSMPLTKKKVIANEMNGTPIRNVLEAAADGNAVRAEVEAELAARETSRAAKRRRKASNEDKEEEAVEDRARAAPAGSDDEAEEDEGGSDGDGEYGNLLERLQPHYVTPQEAEEILRRLWEREWEILNLIYQSDVVAQGELAAAKQLRSRRRPVDSTSAAGHLAHRKEGYCMFFLRRLAVAPNKFRPVSRLGDSVYEHPQNTLLQRVVTLSLDIVEVKSEGDGGEATVDLSRSIRSWLQLQLTVNNLMDSTMTEEKNPDVSGIKQVLEKKEGLFRKNMMGKRVNFAARSVISPDPYISGGEIGVPPYFAKKLSFPERVTAYNVEELRQLVINGPDIHPGAVAVEDEHGRLISLSIPAYKDKARREALAKQLLTAAKGALGSSGPPRNPGKIVYRHLRDGDLMLTNRQPTLHKPGMMAHRARVLKGERTIRMHYVNCSTFNADFDGDEINLHLPQDQFCRAEGYGIVHADQQYIVPTDGKPIRGLIQDHIIAGTLLTKKDTFLNRRDFMQLVYTAVAPTRRIVRAEQDIQIPRPAILKPQPMWTGKQVLTTIMRNLTQGLPQITITAGGKVPVAYFGKDSGEGDLLVYKGEHITGVIDKNQFGKYGLVHGFQELYGGEAAGRLQASMSRLFTAFLQHHGFTCGMDDVLLVPAAEQSRAQSLLRAEGLAVSASAEFVGQKALAASSLEDPRAVQSREKLVVPALSEMYRSDWKGTGVANDVKVSGVMHPLSSEIIKNSIPSGQFKPFLHNCMSLMTVTGAKGSIVNFSQISCLLGQQELEGRRTPRMASGKTLPCFRAYDAGARSGGFIGDRFLSGLRPQEYYFHCMAGRDGLVDTAVKTARSGYLQRCLVKNLESLRVHYDATVRDDADGSVVQFMYGEDGIDVMNVSYLRQFGFLARNAARLAQVLDVDQSLKAAEVAGLSPMEEAARAEIKDRAIRLAKAVDKGKDVGKAVNTGPPISSLFPPSVLGVTSESFMDAVTSFIQQNPDGVLESSGVAAKDFRRLMELKFMGSLAAAGEAVGVIAAQSVGEPSTQMTLNTFHMAGRGEANVTLGIPRLRELFMTAAKRIATPVMKMPLREGRGTPDAQRIVSSLRRLRLAECLQGLEVAETPVSKHSETAISGRARVYRITLQFHPEGAYPPEARLTFGDLAAAFEKDFLPRLKAAIKQELKRANAKLGAGLVKAASADMYGDGMGGQGKRPRVGAGAGDDEEPRNPKEGKYAANEPDDEDVQEDDENAEENAEFREGKDQWKGRGEERVGYEEDDEEEGEEEDRRGSGARAGSPEADQFAEDDTGSDGAAPSRSGADPRHHRCHAEVVLELSHPKLLMLEIAERVAAQTMVRHTQGISKCYILEGQNGAPPAIQTDGLNFAAAWSRAADVDVDRISTNDVGAVLDTYGVEAARATLVSEVRSVFGAYGIGVDPRHLGLIADFMTFNGGYRPCNRLGIESSASPFLKMSFETATHFLTDATLKGHKDALLTPASRIVMGRPVTLGTGTCSILQALDYKG